MPEAPTMQVLDIIVMSPKETFLVGRLDGPMKPGPWELRLNEEVVATLDITGEAQIEAGRKAKLQPPRVAVSRTSVEKSRFDFTRDEVTLVRQV
ncbi:hypothetical protein DNI29_16565 [Hymenobacter sediminis]|uniref:hypothetical protein n=1 Tax=Hymenobacter sediminis TaxID=2218621 RepID=UPI000DA6A638|nr:hypothetical protein [Hymenobacter sediminis]RPD45766.1 hypothetical protein DNI29_16565 [Hymenobacter sediminis]